MEEDSSRSVRWPAATPRPPEFSAPATLDLWNTRRLALRATLEQLLGALPARPAMPSVQTVRREERDGYTLEKFHFENEAGATVPGYLLLPAGATSRRPAILYCHWHGGEYRIGKEELFQAAHTPEAPGPALARRGYVVLGIDAPCFGERADTGADGADRRAEEDAAKLNLWLGRSFWGMLLRDDRMALDYLASRPEVDSGRIGVTGISMGATRSWWLMALDERLRAGVAVACLTRYQDLIARGALAEHSPGYYVPGVLRHFDTEAIVALIAPRPVLFQTGDRDGGSPVEGVRAIAAAVRPVYRLHGREEDFQSHVYPGLGHVYTEEMWRRTLDWLDRHLEAGR